MGNKFGLQILVALLNFSGLAWTEEWIGETPVDQGEAVACSWAVYPDVCLSGVIDISESVTSLGECKEKCISQTSFDCRSVVLVVSQYAAKCEQLSRTIDSNPEDNQRPCLESGATYYQRLTEVDGPGESN
jgi:hypothetical protein